MSAYSIGEGRNILPLSLMQTPESIEPNTSLWANTGPSLYPLPTMKAEGFFHPSQVYCFQH